VAPAPPAWWSAAAGLGAAVNALIVVVLWTTAVLDAGATAFLAIALLVPQRVTPVGAQNAIASHVVADVTAGVAA